MHMCFSYVFNLLGEKCEAVETIGSCLKHIIMC